MNENRIDFYSSIDEKSIGSLISEKQTFIIPYQQRGYRWRVRNILELLDDLLEFIKILGAKKYCLQPLAVSKIGRQYKVWDGQQRLTTIKILCHVLGMTEPYSFIYERDRDGERANFMLAPVFKGEEENNIDFYYIGRAAETFRDCFDNNEFSTVINRKNPTEYTLFKRVCSRIQEPNMKNNLISLLKDDFANKRLEFLWYEVDDSKATEIFRDINSGKISLTNPELIKALLLGKNSMVRNRELVAAQFAEIESVMLDDHFWYMFQAHETKMRGNIAERISSDKFAVDMKSRLMRMDFIFNLVAGVSYDKYLKDPIASFRFFYDNKEKIDELWNRVRKIFNIIKTLYDDVEAYHYIGFLTYCHKDSQDSKGYKRIIEIIELYENNKKSDFLQKLKAQICVKDPDYLDFNRNKRDLRMVLLLHNITTILYNFANQKQSKKLHLDRPFEIFPFELLYRQEWNIEHIAPATDNPLKKQSDRAEWIASTMHDYKDLFVEASKKINSDKSRFTIDERTMVSEALSKYQGALDRGDTTQQDNTFDFLFTKVLDIIENKLGNDKIIEKYCIGNYALLDETTNKCFHNSLFATKRRIVIAATGQKVDTLGHEVKLVYIPPCTKAAFMKFYNTGSAVSLSDWGQTDADDYRNNILFHIREFIR